LNNVLADCQTELSNDESPNANCHSKAVVRFPVRTPIFRFKPLHDRLLEYQRVRDRIFAEEMHPIPKPRYSTLRWRHHCNKIKSIRKFYCAAIINDKPSDDFRPYASIKMFDTDVSGLIDTGATVSCIASDLARKILDIKPPVFDKIRIGIRTADGHKHAAVGTVTTNVFFRGQTQTMTFLVIPALSQNLYLGVDFCRIFGLAKDILGSINEIDHLLNTCELLPSQREKLNAVICLFPSFAKEGLGRTSLVTHVIDTGDSKPIKQRHFVLSPAKEKLLFMEVDRMLALGVIEESQSPWSSPVTLVVKPNKVRMCLDARKVNEVTVKDAYPLPLIDGILSRLPKAQFITSLDLKDAFWQIPLDERSKEKTAFTVPNRPLYQFRVMPFGLCNAPQTMSRLMDKIVSPHLRTKVFVYLDDLLIITETFDEHIQVLQEIAMRFREAGLTINVEKSKFLRNEVTYLGHVIGNGHIKTDPDKVQAVQDFPQPRSVKQLRMILGMCGYYQRFVKNYASITAPLTDMLKKNNFVWTDERLLAFENLKASLCSAPVLHSPDFSRPFSVQCDASKHGIGAVLVQRYGEEEVPVAFMSKKYNQAQRNYSVVEQECLAVVLAIKKFRGYIEGQDFEVVTDHASLKWLMSQTDLHGRLARWALKLQGFRFSINHRKGSRNVVPDALSRKYAEDSDSDDLTTGCPFVHELTDTTEIDLTSEAFSSDSYLELIKRVQSEPQLFPDIRVCDGFVYKKTEFSSGDPVQEENSWKLWVPAEMTHSLIMRAHEHPLCAHGGLGKTLYRLKTWYFWPKMTKQVRDVILSCEVCKQSKAPNQILRPPMGDPVRSERVFQHLYLDLLGPYPRSTSGHTGIIVVLDHKSKFTFLEPIRRFTAAPIVEFLEKRIFHTFGVPEMITTDNGVQFRANLFKNLLEKYGVTHRFTAAYSPQSNASERVNRVILAAIRSYVHPSQKDWDANLSAINFALRSSRHVSVSCSPYFIVFGQHMISNGKTFSLLRNLGLIEDSQSDVRPCERFELLRAQIDKHLSRAHERSRKTYNLRSRPVQFEIGQMVYYRNFSLSSAEKHFNSKLAPKFLKAKIHKRIGNCYYELVSPAGKRLGTFHAKDIRT